LLPIAKTPCPFDLTNHETLQPATKQGEGLVGSHRRYGFDRLTTIVSLEQDEFYFGVHFLEHLGSTNYFFL
jgi:hypothetical protein